MIQLNDRSIDSTLSVRHTYARLIVLILHCICSHIRLSYASETYHSAPLSLAHVVYRTCRCVRSVHRSRCNASRLNAHRKHSTTAARRVCGTYIVLQVREDISQENHNNACRCTFACSSHACNHLRPPSTRCHCRRTAVGCRVRALDGN